MPRESIVCVKKVFERKERVGMGEDRRGGKVQMQEPGTRNQEQ